MQKECRFYGHTHTSRNNGIASITSRMHHLLTDISYAQFLEGNASGYWECIYMHIMVLTSWVYGFQCVHREWVEALRHCDGDGPADTTKYAMTKILSPLQT